MAKPSFAGSLFIGESLNGLPSPIFYDPHYPMYVNSPPVTVITGSPGSGKTFASSLFVSQASAMNKVVFAIDPKGDLLSLKYLEKSGDINKTTIWSAFDQLNDGEVSLKNYGLLDPMALTDDRAKNISLTISVVRELVSGIQDEDKGTLDAIIKDVAESSKPTFSRVITQLRKHKTKKMRFIGNELQTKTELPIGKLLVGNATGNNPFKDNDGLMIVSLLGLTLPDSSKEQDKYTNEEAMSIAIMRLITYSIDNTLQNLPRTTQKLLFIDEAWAVINTDVGRAMVTKVAQMGRALGMALILTTQSPRHLEKDGQNSLNTSVSTRFAFKNVSDDDNRINRELMRLPANEGWEEIFPKLSSGRCIFQDCNGNHALIQIKADPRWAKAFETNPTKLTDKRKL